MNKFLPLLLALLLALAAPATAAVDLDQAAFEQYGTVLAVTEDEASVLIRAEGYYGYHMDEAPSMTVDVEIDEHGTILSAVVVEAKAQTPGFDTMITQDYMDQVYAGAIASPVMEADAVSGATATSQAVRYAVQTAAHYAQNVYGYAADTDAADKAELNEVFPAEYETIQTDYAPDAQKVGTVLYAARGTAPDGSNVVAMKVKSSPRISFRGSAGTGWTAAEPNPFTMIVVVDQATSKVCAWRILVDGTKRASYFAVPAEKIDAYMTVEIADEAVFDEFMDGLVLTLDYETEASDDGPLITGTSIVYTGKTEQGTFSSQLVRNCFRTAAAFYANAL